MTPEEKVVGCEIAAALEKAGWYHSTEWTWRQIGKAWSLQRTDAMTRLSRRRPSYSYYPAPDVSELLGAMARGVEIHISEALGVFAQTTDAQGTVYQSASSTSLADALGKLWCALYAL